MSLPYTLDSNGIYRPSVPITHRDKEYDQSGFNMLFPMQKTHFLYRGRHRFLLAAFDRYTRLQQAPLSAVDLGGALVVGYVIWRVAVRSVFKPLHWQTRPTPR